jgi:quercetin dioxygenase-like cupin family protein
MKTIHIEKAEMVKNPHGVQSQKLYTSEHASVMQLTLKPGEKLRQHITPVDVVFYVLEGKGIVEIGDEKKEVVKDTMIDSPKGIMHCWYNESDAILRFLVVKVPFPTEPTQFLT